MIANLPALRGRKAAFVRRVIEGMTAKNAALAAGYSPASAAQIGARLLRDPAVRATLENSATLKEETLAQVDEIRRLAVARGDAGAAIRAVELRCSITGMVA